MQPQDPRAQARLQAQRRPNDAIAWILLSEAELDAGDPRAGEAAARVALRLQPGHPEALARLGRAQWMQRHFEQAAASLRAAAERAPQHAGIAVWLAHALEDTGEAEAAAKYYGRAHALAPEHPQIAAYLLAWRRRLCDWRDLDRLSRQVRDAVRSGQASVEPFAFLSEDADAAEQLRCAQIRASLYGPVRPRPPVRARAPGEPVRIGLLSNGFGAHPTGLLVVALIEALAARSEVETHLFALESADGSDIRTRLVASARLHAMHHKPHAEIAQRIRDAGIDVLFDLRGWGGGGAPEVLAMRPAPVQVNWLAYPGTSGAPWIDYVLADAFVLPPALEPHFSERVLRLPRCFQPSDTRRTLAPPAPRSAYGLPEQGVVLCCFNNSYKLNPRSSERLFQVLRGVPGSVLWLLSGPGRADERVRQAAQQAGVEPRRLVFMPKQPHAEYMTRLQRADLFLDTNPYNAHTTASDALWAGCPVLTVPGSTFASRVAGSLNHHLGMDAMNAADDAAFVARGVELGNDPAALRATRMWLADRRRASPLFDMDGFAADFAAAAQAMAAKEGLQAQR
jgi:predicted O-linked N-acetylglucosamine transferase (SPINDLY family)